METINNIELNDPLRYPDDACLTAVLGDSFQTYLKLLNLYNANDLIYQWRYYHDGKAWLCKVQKKKKTIVWMSAWRGYMQATIYVHEKYIEALHEINLSEETLNKINKTKNVGKSKPCIFEIREEKNLVDFEKTMLFKISSK